MIFYLYSWVFIVLTVTIQPAKLFLNQIDNGLA